MNSPSVRNRETVKVIASKVFNVTFTSKHDGTVLTRHVVATNKSLAAAAARCIYAVREICSVKKIDACIACVEPN